MYKNGCGIGRLKIVSSIEQRQQDNVFDDKLERWEVLVLDAAELGSKDIVD